MVSGGVFISYRRDDSAGWTGRLYDRASLVLGSDRVFVDVEAIAPGEDFAEAIEEILDRVETVLVVIGPGWLAVRDGEGRRRIDDPGDYVRQEVEGALVRDLRVVPVLVGGAEMPSEQGLPEEIRSLARRNAVSLRDSHFVADVDGLLDELSSEPSGGSPNNLPAFGTSFVGREEEQAEVKNLVREARLVTITGVGGAGKTRLALRVASELVEEFPDGVWLIALGALTDPELIDVSAAEVLGIPDEARRALRESVLDYLGDRRALLLVDNCEHLVREAASFVSDVIARAPGCRVLATSRELLGVGGEVAYGLQSMRMPTVEEAEMADPDYLTGHDAVRLFLERAQAAVSGFRLSKDNSLAIVEICHRLDGMPLALELAAARLRSFTPRQVADNLDNRFRLLTGGSRTALPRQQTLAATIDWSYQLLQDEEQRLFERLSVFQSGFTLEAVTEVCTDDDLDPVRVLELLPSLVDKSLVVADTKREEARYRLLETLRQYASERLDETGTSDQIRTGHARFFRDLAIEAQRHLQGPEEPRWLKIIDRELDNLRQAMTWGVNTGNPQLGLEIASYLRSYWADRFKVTEGLNWVERTLAAAGPEATPHLRAQALVGYGRLLGMTDRLTEGEQAFEEAIGIYEELDEQGADNTLLEGYPGALNNLAWLLEASGKSLERRRQLLVKALEVGRRLGRPVGLLLSNLAEIFAEAGDYVEARRRFEEAREESAHESARLKIGRYEGFGMLELADHQPAKARTHFEKAVRFAEEANMTHDAALHRAYVALCDSDLGDTAAGERFASHITTALQDPDVKEYARLRQRLVVMRASISLAAGDYQEAAKLLGVSQSLEEDNQTVVTWEMKDRRDRTLNEVKSKLGEDATEQAMKIGRHLDDKTINQLLTSEPSSSSGDRDPEP